MKFKKNDVIFWSYTDDFIKLSKIQEYLLYWAKSRFAIFNGKEFVDTFSSLNHNVIPVENKNYLYKHLGNLNEFELQKYSSGEDLKKYYKEKDILDISHPNNSQGIYLRIGAKRDPEIIKKTLLYKIDSTNREINYLKDRLAEYHEWASDITKYIKDIRL